MARYREQLGLNHRTVNHSLYFIDPVTGVHTQHAESNWSTAKEKFKKMKGNTNPNFLIEYLHEFMWRRWYGDIHPNGCFPRLLQDIRDFKNRGRGGSETRPEVIFPISDEERMRVAFSPELENAA